jgi:hypothetical protein
VVSWTLPATNSSSSELWLSLAPTPDQGILGLRLKSGIGVACSQADFGNAPGRSVADACARYLLWSRNWNALKGSQFQVSAPLYGNRMCLTNAAPYARF